MGPLPKLAVTCGDQEDVVSSISKAVLCYVTFWAWLIFEEANAVIPFKTDTGKLLKNWATTCRWHEIETERSAMPAAVVPKK